MENIKIQKYFCKVFYSELAWRNLGKEVDKKVNKSGGNLFPINGNEILGTFYEN